MYFTLKNFLQFFKHVHVLRSSYDVGGVSKWDEQGRRREISERRKMRIRGALLVINESKGRVNYVLRKNYILKKTKRKREESALVHSISSQHSMLLEVTLSW